MKENELYLKIEQNIKVTHKKIILDDIAKLYSIDKNAMKEMGKQVVIMVQGENETKYIFSILKIIELIHKSYPSFTVINMGETDFIIEYKKPGKVNKVLEYSKAAAVSLTIFFGSAFTIMTFNTDVNVSEVFDKVYLLVMGSKKSEGSILEIAYCIGIPIGIIVFFNHFSKKKTEIDPTPIQIQMRSYEEEINEALIQDASREGKVIDSD